MKFSLDIKSKRSTILFARGLLQDVVLQHSDVHVALALSSPTAVQDTSAALQSREDAHPYIPDSLPSLLIIFFRHLSWPVSQVTFLALMLLHS